MGKEIRKPVLTKKHQARLDRERTQTRYILIASITVFVLVVAFVAYGIIEQSVIQPSRPVARVNGQAIPVRDFVAEARYARYGILQQYIQYQQFAQMFGSDEQTQQYFQSTMSQIEAQLEPTLLGQNVIDRMVEDILIREETERRGITLNQADVDKAVQEYFAYFAEGTPTPAPTTEIKPTSTLSPAQYAILSPTPTPTATLTATPEPAAEVTATPTTVPGPSPTSAPQPTATPYTLELFEETYEQAVEDIGTNLDISEKQFRHIIESQMLRTKVRDLVTIDVAREQEQVWARHILVTDEVTALAALDRLAAGEDFGALAAEISTDGSAASGGDLGWFNRERMVPEFSDVAFALEIGEISEPVQSQFGWHIIQVLGHEFRQLSDDEFEQAKDAEFSKWLDTQREAAEIEVLDEVWQEASPTEPSLEQLLGS